MRTLIDLPKPLMDALAAEAATSGRSRAAVVREALDDYLKNRRATTRASAFGLWKDRADVPQDGLSYQRALRDE